MEQVKFRAWNVERKRMSYSEECMAKECNASMLTKLEYFFHSLTYNEEDGNRILMLYTGLKDKNGKEIYEGDIIIPGLPGHLIYKKECFVLESIEELYFNECHPLNDGLRDIFVIGNIYENPELIKEK